MLEYVGEKYLYFQQKHLPVHRQNHELFFSRRDMFILYQR